MKKTYWLSLRELKVHEFLTTFRYMRSQETTWAAEFELASSLTKSASNHFIKAFGALVAFYLVFSTLQDGQLLSITILERKISVPTALATSTYSLTFLIALLLLNNWIVLLIVRSRFGSKILFSGFSSETFANIKGEENFAHSLPLVSNYFFEAKVPASSVLAALILSAIGALLVPFLAIGGYLLVTQFSLLFNFELSWVEFVSTIFGLTTILLSFAYLILFHLPMPYGKTAGSFDGNF